MNEMRVFTSEEFGQVRSVVVDGEPWFVGKDITDALKYANPQKAIRDHVDDEDKANIEKSNAKIDERFVHQSKNDVFILDSLGRKQYPVLINESGLYSLILNSKLPRKSRDVRIKTMLLHDLEKWSP